MNSSLVLIEYPLVSNEDSPETFSRAEPVLVTDLQMHSRLPSALVPPADDPQYVKQLLAAARALAETECRIQLLTATWELRLDGFPSLDSRASAFTDWPDSIQIPRPPLQQLLSVKYLDSARAEQTLYDVTVSPAITSAVFSIDLKSMEVPVPGELHLNPGQQWPTTSSEPNAVRIRFKAGFGDAPADVRLYAPGVLQWILILAGTMYEHREKEITGRTIAELRFVDGLLDPWRCRRSLY